MDPFPSLRPVAWNVVPGVIPSDVTTTGDGRTATVRHRRTEVGRTWPAEFIVTPAEYQQILDHYFDSLSGYRKFSLSTATLPAKFTPAGYGWTYAAPPQVNDTSDPLLSVSVLFECVEGGGYPRIPGQLGSVGLTLATQGIARANPSPALTSMPWQCIRLLLPVSGEDDSTTITNISGYPATITAGDGKISSAETIFGKKSITTTSATSVNLCTITELTADVMPTVFTLEAQCYRPSTSGAIVGIYQIGATNTPGRLAVYYTTTDCVGLELYGVGEILTTGAVPLDQFFHLAIIGYANGNLRVTIDGVSGGLVTTPYTLGNGGGIILQGAEDHYLSQIRLSFAEIYTIPFTPPAAAFPES